jgi:threonine/homoserine/homoserine lactone efflux protein
MPTFHTFIALALVSLGLALIPGPSTFFLMSQGALHGRNRALASVAGIEIASAVRVLATAAGLSALLASSAAAFSAIRWVGVAYLAYLGLRAMTAVRRAEASESEATSPDAGSSTKALRKGVLVGLGNVKMAIFYLAFFPQFVHADRGSEVTQILILGAVFWIIGLAGDLLYALASATIGARVRARPRAKLAQARTEAVSYLALAGWTATSG